MTVSDVSPYWTIDQMIWNALEDTGLTWGSDLDLWRKQQNELGKAGMNFKTGEIPERPGAHHLPALMFGYEIGLETPEELRTHAAMSRIYPIQIVGFINTPKHRENDANQKIKRFQHLVEGTLGEALRELSVSNSSYLPSGATDNPLDVLYPGTPEFPNWAEESAIPMFIFPIFALVQLGHLWQV